MNRTMALALSVLTVAALRAEAGQPDPEWVVRAEGLGPSRGRDWSSAGGMEAQFRYWSTEHSGVALCAGYSRWNAVEEYLEDDDGASFVAVSISGRTMLAPVGVSLLYATDADCPFRLVLEGGLRYAFADSRILVEGAYADDARSGYVSDTVKVGDTLLGVLGLDVEMALSREARLTAGLGYQADLVEPTETAFGSVLGETSFEAVTARIGLSLSF
jgi:hypothetical protein